jgi:hypothetical protein
MTGFAAIQRPIGGRSGDAESGEFTLDIGGVHNR